jgi:hypothetical protein
MAICIWENFKTVKNTAMDSSFGLIFPARTQRRTNMSNTMTDSGGVGYLMGKVFIKKSMVFLILIIGDLYTGSFKNGLKHGEGV